MVHFYHKIIPQNRKSSKGNSAFHHFQYAIQKGGNGFLPRMNTDERGYGEGEKDVTANGERLFSTTDDTDSTDGYDKGNGERRICYG
jgi:hypothetical protein